MADETAEAGKINDPMSPRVHLDRAAILLKAASGADGELLESLLIGAVNSARSYYENLFTRAETPSLKYQGNDIDQTVLTKIFSDNVRHFKLIEYMRIQDFHRNPVILRKGASIMLGPIKLKTSSQFRSTAVLTQSSDGSRKVLKAGNASVRSDRPISTNGLDIEDPDTGKMIDIRDALTGYLEDARKLEFSTN